MAKDSLSSHIRSLNKGTKVPAVNVVRTQPEIAATISKLLISNNPNQFKPGDKKSFYQVNQGRVNEISQAIQNRITDSENMLQLFPDLELGAQILVSSILSPKDMVNVELNYTSSLEKIPLEVVMKLTETFKDEMEKEYKISQGLYEKLRTVLFVSGSHATAVIPESSLDDLINGTTGIKPGTEAIKELIDGEQIVNHGFLGLPTRLKKDEKAPGVAYGFESIASGVKPGSVKLKEELKVLLGKDAAGVEQFIPGLEVCDNFKLLKLPRVIERVYKNKVRDYVKPARVGAENHANLNSKEYHELLFKRTKSEAKIVQTVSTSENASRKSIGRPLNLRLPSESVLPVHVPGDPTNHIAYIVIIDEEGNPITRASNSQYMNNMQAGLNTTGANSSLQSSLLSRARENLAGSTKPELGLDQATQIYSSIIENELIDRIKNGSYGAKASIAKNEEVYRIMLARSLANQFTRLLFIPSELMSYYAYKYYDNGVGKSILDDLSTLISLRGILLFAKVMNLTKNAINTTHVNMTLDPSDPDPEKTIELASHDIIKMRQQYFPLGINSPVDLVDWINRAGFEFSFEGHPGLPETKFDFETRQMGFAVPDSELDETLRKQTIMAMSLTPETVDNGFSSEFATTIVSNNILLAKRVSKMQEVFQPQITEDVKRIGRNDITLKQKLLNVLFDHYDAIKDNFDTDVSATLEQYKEQYLTHIVDEFIDSIDTELPKPDITTLETQGAAFDSYSDYLDKTLDAFVSSDFITPEIAGAVGENIDAVKNALKAHFLRAWMAKNGFMSELGDIVSLGSNDNPSIDLSDVMTTHIEGVERTALNFIKKMKPVKEASDTDIANLDVQASDVSSSGGGDEDTTDESGGDGGDMDMGDMDFGLDETPDEEPNPDETA